MFVQYAKHLKDESRSLEFKSGVNSSSQIFTFTEVAEKYVNAFLNTPDVVEGTLLYGVEDVDGMILGLHLNRYVDQFWMSFLTEIDHNLLICQLQDFL